jgi:4-amino-4-deoxy-L-arabinose transferase-like glycosyltransferase
MNIRSVGKEKFVAAALLAALALRLAWGISLDPHQLYFPDSRQWSAIAVNFLSGNGLIVDEGTKALRPPVYSLFLSLLYFVFGKENLLAVRIVQAIVSSCTCLTVYLFAKRIFAVTAARIAMAACAVYPFLVYYSGAVLTETLFIFILSLIMLSLSGRKFAWAGVFFGLGILCRSELVFFLLCALAGTFAVLRWKDALRKAAVMAAIAGAILLPWTIRNYLVFHAFVPLTTMSGYTFYEGNSPYNSTGGPGGALPFPDTRGMGEIEKDRFLRHEAIAAIRENPGRMAGLLWSKFKRLWNVRLNTDNPAYVSRLTVLASMISFTPVLVLFVAGLALSWKRRRELIYLYLLVLHTTAINLAFVSSLRYRLPLEPFMIVVASYALVLFAGRVRPAKAITP